VPDEEDKNFAIVPMVPDFLRRKRPEAVQQTEHPPRADRGLCADRWKNGYAQYGPLPDDRGHLAPPSPLLCRFPGRPE